MPLDPVTLRSELVREKGQPAMRLVTQYQGPVYGEDPHKDLDVAMATKMMAWLLTYYPGYPWHTTFDSAQKIATVSIPILMGTENKYIINLTTHDLGPTMVDAAGTVLEVYRQMRGAMEVGRFLEARAKHSALTVRSRRMPV